MKRINLIIMLLLAQQFSQAQSIQKSVIGATGTVMSNSGMVLRSTVGETVTSSFTNGSIKITQGFQQNIVPNIALPITGLEFMALRVSPYLVQLQWQTLTEMNNSGFYIERKLENETDFSNVTFVGSKAEQGNSQSILKYDYPDDNPYFGATYYRIKQVDVEGKSSYSLIRVVNGDQSSGLSLSVWPVPSKGVVNIQVLGSNKTNEIELLDALGHVVKSASIDKQMTYRIEGLQPGIYYVALKSNNKMVQKIIIE